MTSRLSAVVVDCAAPQRMASFWCEVLGYRVTDVDDEGVEISGPEGSVPVLFLKVPEGKSVKNRVHLDVRAADHTQADELARLIALGATEVDIGQGRQTWYVLADPEGNEFCLLSDLMP